MSSPERLAKQAAWYRAKFAADPEFRNRKRKASQEWRRRNAAKVKADRAAWYARNRAEILARAAAKRRTPEAIARAAAGMERSRRLSEERHAEAVARRVEIAALDREVRLRAKRMRLPEVLEIRRAAKRRQKQARRARQRGVESRLSPRRFEELRVVQRGRCAACRGSGLELTLDHIIPLALGGPHTDANTQLLCRMCNSKKSANPPEIFMQSMGFLL